MRSCQHCSKYDITVGYRQNVSVMPELDPISLLTYFMNCFEVLCLLGCQSIRTHVKSYHANSYPSQLVHNTKSYPSHLVPNTNSYPTRTQVTTNSYPTTNLPTCGLTLAYKLKSTYPTYHGVIL